MKHKVVNRDIKDNIKAMKQALSKSEIDENGEDRYNMYQLFEYLVSYNALKHNLGLGDCGDVDIVDEKIGKLFGLEVRKVKHIRKLRNKIAHLFDVRERSENFNDSIVYFRFRNSKLIVNVLAVLNEYSKKGC